MLIFSKVFGKNVFFKIDTLPRKHTKNQNTIHTKCCLFVYDYFCIQQYIIFSYYTDEHKRTQQLFNPGQRNITNSPTHFRIMQPPINLILLYRFNQEVKEEMNNPNKKTVRIAKSNLDLIQNLQKAVRLEERKKVTRTDIINVAISELFNKKDDIDDVDYVGIIKVLRCYNIL